MRNSWKCEIALERIMIDSMKRYKMQYKIFTTFSRNLYILVTKSPQPPEVHIPLAGKKLV
jgi:hypothetical protein